jgi:anti-anti-sigma factor
MQMPQDYRARSIGGLPVVSTPDEIDIASAGQLREALLAASAWAAVVVMDMTETTFCDSSGLDLFAEISELLDETGGELRVVVCSAIVRRPMTVTGVDQLFRTFPTLDKALTARPRRCYHQAA